MASDRVNLAEASLSADLIAQQNFSISRRGFDPDEVRNFLAKVAAELLHLHDRQAPLEAALREAEYRVAHPTLDEETLLSAVGEETAHILRSAHEAAADIKSRAEENASRILKEAHQQADGLRGDAESVLARRTEEAEAMAAKILDTARLEGERLSDQARQQAKAIRSQTESERKAMIEGASATREKILTNLARKRRVALVQVEQLLAGRERLLESYQVVRETLDQVTTELSRAETAARAAADAVRLRPLPMDDPDTLELPVAVADAVGPVDAEELSEAVAPSSEWPRPEPADAIDAVSVEAPVGADVKSEAPAPEHEVEAAAVETASVEPESWPGAEAEIEAVAEIHPDAVATPEAHVEVAASGEPDVQTAASPTSVDSLFARIRADRAAAVERAHEVLAEPDPAAANGTAEAVAGPVPVAAEPEPSMSNVDEALLQRRDETVGAIEAALTRRLKRALQDEQNDLLDRLRGVRPRPTAASVLPTRSAHATRFAEASRPFLGQAASAGAAFVGSIIGEHATRGEGLEELDTLADNLAGAIVAPLRRRLEEVLMASEGDDRAALAESFGAAYREWKTARIELTAADHVASAFAGGAFAATPAGTALRWLVEDTDGPCPDCDDNVLAGPLPKGERFPTGQRHPPAHTGCRCLLIPKA